MKIAVLAESLADRRAIEVLASAILDREIEFEAIQPRSGGFHAVVSAIGPTLRSLHYRRLADGLIVVVDSDNTPVDPQDADGRVQRIQNGIAQVQANLTSMPDFDPIKTAVGVAAPSLEAWLLFGIDNQCTETSWIVRMNEGQLSATEIRRLKEKLYGTDRPDLVLETERMVGRSTDLIREDRLEALAQAFPYGFGQLLNDLRGW